MIDYHNSRLSACSDFVLPPIGEGGKGLPAVRCWFNGFLDYEVIVGQEIVLDVYGKTYQTRVKRLVPLEGEKFPFVELEVAE